MRAQALLDAHAEADPGVARWIAAVHQQAANNGEVRTLYGRRRQLPNIYSALPSDAAEARRQAVNTGFNGKSILADVTGAYLDRRRTTPLIVGETL